MQWREGQTTSWDQGAGPDPVIIASLCDHQQVASLLSLFVCKMRFVEEVIPKVLPALSFCTCSCGLIIRPSRKHLTESEIWRCTCAMLHFSEAVKEFCTHRSRGPLGRLHSRPSEPPVKHYASYSCQSCLCGVMCPPSCSPSQSCPQKALTVNTSGRVTRKPTSSGSFYFTAAGFGRGF